MRKFKGYLIQNVNLPPLNKKFEVGKTYHSGFDSDGEAYSFAVEKDAVKLVTECSCADGEQPFIAVMVEGENPHPYNLDMDDPDQFLTVSVISLLSYEELFRKALASITAPNADDHDSLYEQRGDETTWMSLLDDSQLAGVGGRNTLVSAGERGILISDRDDDVLAVVGEDADILSAGRNAFLISAGYNSGIQSMGSGSSIASAGHHSYLTSIKDECDLAASGAGNNLTTHGDHCRLASSGGYNYLTALGQNSVIAACGADSTATGSVGTWIALAEYDEDLHCIGFVTGCVGQGDLKPGAIYRAAGGRFVEIPDCDGEEPNQDADLQHS